MANDRALIAAIDKLTQSLEKSRRADTRKEQRKAEKEAEKAEEAKRKKRVKLAVRSISAVNQTVGRAASAVGSAAANVAAAATDPRDVSGIGQSRALNQSLDSLVGSGVGNFLRNVSGVSNLQGRQQAIQGGIESLVRGRAELGLDTPAALIRAEATRADRVERRFQNQMAKARVVTRDITANVGTRKQLEAFGKQLEEATATLRIFGQSLGLGS